MDEYEMLELDRAVSRGCELSRRWHRGMAAGEALEPPSFPDILSSSSFLALRDRPDSDPLKAGLSAWLYRLLDDKANRAVIAAIGFERSVRRHRLETPERAELSLSGMLARALSEPERRPLWLDEFFSHAGDLADGVSLYWERRKEVARRLGLTTPDEIELPSPAVLDAAHAWIATSADLAAELRSEDLATVIRHSLGMEASSGWPSRITPRALLDSFRESNLLSHLELDPGRLVASVAPASHLRAYARLGAAFVDSAASDKQPFCIAHDAFGLRRRTMGALFAALPLSRVFARRTLGVASARLSDHRRALGRVILLASRAQAFRVLLRARALEGSQAFRRAYGELGEHIFGTPLPQAAAGTFFRLHPDDPQRFAGLLLSADEELRMTDAHDEDWYRNPRAADQLRSEAALVPECKTSADALASGSSTLRTMLARVLG